MKNARLLGTFERRKPAADCDGLHFGDPDDESPPQTATGFTSEIRMMKARRRPRRASLSLSEKVYLRATAFFAAATMSSVVRWNFSLR